MGKETNGSYLAQGEVRANRTRPSGSHTAQGEGGARGQKTSGSHLEQGEGGAKAVGPSGSHLRPHPALSDMTNDRQGGTKRGHDRTNPTAGKSKSGSKFSQHPNNRKTKR